MYKIVDATEVAPKKLYFLLQEIYQSTEFMAEDFQEKFPSQENFENQIQPSSMREGSFFLAAVDGADPVGYIHLYRRPQKKLGHTAELNMGVVPSAQGKGLARELLAAAFTRLASEKKIEIVYLMVREDNLAAVQLYKKNGFDVVAALEKDTKVGAQYFTGLLMRRFVSVIKS